MKPQQSKPSLDKHQKSELRFILVDGVAKMGTSFAVVYFFGNYLFLFGFSIPTSKIGDFLHLTYKSIIFGVVFGLVMGLVEWHQYKKNSK
jgi:hypothetical protein